LARVSQGESPFVALQMQVDPAEAVTVMLPVPPVAGMFPGEEEIE
jgi:hypothetical protein